jgi:hypothetical protein
MISQELKLYEEPKYTYQTTKYNHDYNLYQSLKKFTIDEIRDAVKHAKNLGIKPGNKYKHMNSQSGYFLTITGWDFHPSSQYYTNTPQVILAKGNHNTAVECSYTVEEIIKMEQIK